MGGGPAPPAGRAQIILYLGGVSGGQAAELQSDEPRALDAVEAELAAAGKSIAQLEDAEPEPSLGNGGLGRLAACFMDSIATLGLPGEGVGLCYHYGLFRQLFSHNCQTEQPDGWIEEESWLRDTGRRYRVRFGARQVTGRLYEIDLPGYGGKSRSRLRLFDLEGVDPSLIRDGITFDKTDIEHNLTLFLYPDDSDRRGGYCGSTSSISWSAAPHR